MRSASSKAAVAAAVIISAALGSAVTGGGTAAVATVPMPATSLQAGSCDGGQSGDGAFYPGDAASETYEDTFVKGFAIPHLSTHVPQGITFWKNWKGTGQNVLIMSMYRKVDDVEKNSYLVAFDASNGKHLGTVEVAGGHLGGIAIAGKYLFGQDADKKAPTKEPVRRYKLTKLADKLKEAIKTDKRPYLGRESGLQTIAGAGFMVAYEGRVWAGHFNNYENDKMYEYKVSSEGKLTVTGSSWEVPRRTQGVLVTSDRFIFSVSDGNNQGKIVVSERKHKLSDADQRCFVVPSMGENMARNGNEVFLVFEGGSYKYPNAENRIKDVHVGNLTDLRKLD